MPKIYNTKESGIKFDMLVDAERADQINNVVRPILTDVSTKGDAALIEYTNRFDRVNIKKASQLKVSRTEINNAYKSCPAELIEALKLAALRIKAYHKKQMPRDKDYTDKNGVRLGNIWKPIERVGLYVPGGKASYPSSVLMNAIPAKVAGVRDMVMVVPAPEGNLNPVVLAAAKIAGIKEIYKIGGAQGVAALAFGTDSIHKVDKIVGPGNAYVAAAKRELYGIVGIDMIAGPSEILVVSDSKTSPEWVAADLLSQAEHDENARSILITDDKNYAAKVIAAVEKTIASLPRAEISSKSWENNGVVIIDPGFANVIDLIDRIAPEHLELALDDGKAEEIAERVRNAGAIFLGRYTPEAIGDYTAGPSHVLPTSGAARFSSGLSVYDFLKRVSVIGCSKESFAQIAAATACLADSEGLPAHALSVRIRN